jgi:hypothetical protein
VNDIAFVSPSAQRTAVQLRPPQQMEEQQLAMTEPVVHHHGRESGGAGHDDVRPTAATACWAAFQPRFGLAFGFTLAEGRAAALYFQ